MRFEDLRLAEPIVRAVATEGYVTPTPIQAKAIPIVLAGNDLLGCARTGTGKTGAFALPILHRLASQSATEPQAKGTDRTSDRSRAGAGRNPGNGSGNGSGLGPRTRRRPPRALVLCPTRELASQIGASFQAYGRNLPLRHTVIFGGVDQQRQVRAVEAGVDILVATPGRLLDLMGQGLIDLRSIEVLVLDEADRMLDMGFINDIRKIVERIPVERQTLLFSATMPDEIRRLAQSILRKPVSVQVDAVASTVQTVSQSVYYVSSKNKPVLLERLLRNRGMGRTLVFTRTKHRADKVVRGLVRAGIRAGAIHGNKSQNARTRALDGFKSGAWPVLVATDIASRGIDVDEITHVINFDIPNIAETYVHRIGRTARAGASGSAVSFCDHEERSDLALIERLIQVRLEVNADEPDLLGGEADRERPEVGRDSKRPGSRGAGGKRPHAHGLQSSNGGLGGQGLGDHLGHGGHGSSRIAGPRTQGADRVARPAPAGPTGIQSRGRRTVRAGSRSGR